MARASRAALARGRACAHLKENDSNVRTLADCTGGSTLPPSAAARSQPQNALLVHCDDGVVPQMSSRPLSAMNDSPNCSDVSVG